MDTLAYPSTALIRIRAGDLRNALVDIGMEPETVDAVVPELIRASVRVAPEGPGIRGYFANEGSVVRVLKVDESYAQIEKLDGTGHWSMPRRDYDSTFARDWHPATMEDLGLLVPADYQPPANAPEGW